MLKPIQKSRIHLEKLSLVVHCEWENCTFSSNISKLLEEHVLNHFKNLYNDSQKTNVNSNEIRCHICYENLPADISCIRHAYYHVYHFKLKSRGEQIKQFYKLPNCYLDKESANAIPFLFQTFICQWKNCHYSNDNIMDFYDHVKDHPFYEGYTENIFKCNWADCEFSTVTARRLSNHTSVHCEKRSCACSNCGLCFSATSKFMDHLKRQIVSTWNKEMKAKEIETVLSTLANSHNPVIPLPKPVIDAPDDAFKCNLCNHLFATKQMLKDHKTRHIASLTCPHCNVTSATPYGLKRHILFRHTEEKPFKCGLCENAFKSSDILSRHLQKVHRTENGSKNIKCYEPNCEFIAKNRTALNIHKGRVHSKAQPIVTKVFVCHKCNQEYINGSLLTLHLSKDHGIKRANNRYRHQYKICSDGKYRLNLFNLKLKRAIKEEPNIEI